MGCVSSKAGVSVTPVIDSSGFLRESDRSSRRARDGSRRLERKEEERKSESGELGKVSYKNGTSVSTRLRNLHRYIEAEQVAAGWPAWLSAVAGEAIRGWVPLKSDSFEKLEKIGQGTYSSVFRARNLDTGKIFALKKVRFDNFEPESVRFMAREIQIVRTLNHPNIVKLEGLITSRMSCSLYLVFEYMDHDLSGLLSSPDVKFTEPQIKCYMRQLLSGLEHCHSRDIIHRDIKGANLLVSNDGILKMADFGLANFCKPVNKEPLTSRVVTLWYRPPELLLGSTDYEASVDLWSVGCIFAELFVKRPILQGRTEVEQLHKIFKLCGSPAEEYWKKSKLPHATIFKPHRPYDSCLHDTFKSLPASAFKLLETLLSVEPYKRGTASSALTSEYFTTKPYACDPSSMPKYPPNKEIDMKNRESRKRIARADSRKNEQEAARRSSKAYRDAQEGKGIKKLAAEPQESETKSRESSRSGKLEQSRFKGDSRRSIDHQATNEGRYMNNASRRDMPLSGPLLVNASSNFAWVKKPKEDLPIDISRKHVSSGAVDPSSILNAQTILKLNAQVLEDAANEVFGESNGQESYEDAKKAMLKKWAQLERPDSFNFSDLYNSQEFPKGDCKEDSVALNRRMMGFKDEGDRVEFSGPLLSQEHKVDEYLEKNERHIRQAIRRSWFQRGKKQQ